MAEQHELQVHGVVLIKRRTLPRTTSGKVQRRECKRAYLNRALGVVAEWHARVPTDRAASVTHDPLSDIGDVEGWLTSAIAARLGLAPGDIQSEQPLVCYGIDSLAALELRHAIETRLAIALPSSTFLPAAASRS